MAARACHDCGAPLNRAHNSARRCWPCRQVRERVAGNAMYQVRLAVLAGELPNLKAKEVPCRDCGVRADRYDHRDYSRPLDVEPVCHSCNLRRGPATPIKKAA